MTPTAAAVACGLTLCAFCAFSNSANAGHWYIADQAGAVFLMDSDTNAEAGTRGASDSSGRDIKDASAP